MDNNKKNYHLEPLWNEIMKIYAEFARICKKHGLRYYASSGTTLGAVRHGSFIPWDDDFDVFMPRPDYERFVDVALHELPANMKILSWRVQKDYFNTFNKVKLVDAAVEERVKRESNLNIDEGIYIDMFPIDGGPSTCFGRCLYFLKRWTYRALGIYLNNSVRSWKHIPLYIVGYVKHLFNPQIKTSDEATRVMDEWFQSYEFVEDGYSIYAAEDRSFYVPGCFKDPVMMAFGTWGEIPVPTRYDSFLRTMFGNYMQLPPKSDRRPKHQIFS